MPDHPAILCDIGNVLVSFDFRHCARALAGQSDFDEESILQVLEPLKQSLESGLIDGEQFTEECIRAIGFRGTKTFFQSIWCDIFSPNPAMAQSISSLAGRLPLYLLSNTSDLHKDHLLRSFGVFRHFTDGVFSFAERSMKPAEAMFHAAIQRFDLRPELTFYIDDLAANIETASRLGLTTWHYSISEHQSFISALDGWLARMLPAKSLAAVDSRNGLS